MDKSAVRVPATRKRKDGSHHPHHRILSIEVAGGFLDGTRLEFSDGLNCIIGGRGTGKTTVLEFIRYILGMMPDVNDSRPRAKTIEGHVRGNLGSGTIYLEVETKHGTRYRAERPWGDDVQVLDRDGEPVPVSLDRDLVFKADIYSQNEIEEIATTPRFQLSLIDRFAEEEIREVETEIARAKRQVQDSAAELRMIEGRIREAEEVVPEIDVVSKRLQELQVANQMEQELATGLGEGQIAEFIEKDEVEAAEIVGDSPLFAGTGLAFKPVHQIDNVEEPAPQSTPDAGPGDGNGEVILYR